MKEPIVSRALKIILYIVFCLGIAGTLTLPWTLDFFSEYWHDSYYDVAGYRAFITAFMMVAAALALFIVWEVIRMLRTIPGGPFVARNVRSLRRAGAVFIILSALFFIKCVEYPTFLTMACGAMLALCSLFAFTLASLFRQAVAFKEENDLTI